jgi:NADPH-dependent glutamate synthase beta subunit-like oxidoreductase
MMFQYTEFPENGLPICTSCQRACPVETDVSAYVAMIARGEMNKALEINRLVNPFPSICGRICDHPCETYCRRAESDAPVAIRALKRFLADQERAGKQKWPHRAKQTRVGRIAIVGAGPAGLTAAVDLVRRGYAVTVFDALPKAGGMMRVGIPAYRLPDDILDYDIDHLWHVGVSIVLNKALGRDFTFSDLRGEGYGAILLATGAHGSRRLNVPGENLPGVMHGIEFLRAAKLGDTPGVGARVVVIGGGDVAMDTARTALRLGAEQVDLFCLEKREEMPAHDWEMKEALDERINIHCGWGVREIRGRSQVEGVTLIACTSVFDADGRFAPQFDQTKTLVADADTVLIAVGQRALFAQAPGDGIETTPNDLYRVDEALQTTVPDVFAAGDAVYGTATVIKAVASGHRAATAIAEFLEGEPVTGNWCAPKLARRPDRGEIPSDWEERQVAELEELAIAERVRTFAEILSGLDEETAIREAARCMRCDAETKSYSYTRTVREQIYHLARDVGNNEAERLAFLQRKMLGKSRRSVRRRRPQFDDLVFLPANLTRLVIDPYRETCTTATTLGASARSPLTMDGPIILDGTQMGTGSVLAAFAQGAARAGVAIRVPSAQDVADARVIRVAPLTAAPPAFPPAAAIEFLPEVPTVRLDADLVHRAVVACRAAQPGTPIGLIVAPGAVPANTAMAIEVGLDYLVLSGIAPVKSNNGLAWREDKDWPDISVLAEAVESLRAINREGDLDLVYLGGILSGADLARALCLGASAVVIGQAARIALAGEEDIEEGSERIARFLAALQMEAAILARCCGKTDIHNLEPEDLRSLTIETSRATGIPLVGSDAVYRTALPSVGAG